MIVPEHFYRVNNWVCLVLGYLSNGALLWLLAKRTTNEMAATYRPVLLLTTLTDLAYLTAYAAAMPVIMVSGGCSAWLMLGPLGWVPQPYSFALLALWTFCRSFSHYSLAVPFVFRYAIICRKKAYGLCAFLAMLTVPLLVCLGHVAVMGYLGYAKTEEDQRRGRKLFGLTAINKSTTSIESNSTALHRQRNDYYDYYVIPLYTSSKLVAQYVMAVMFLVYAVVFLCAWRIYRHLTNLANGNMENAKHRALQLQLSSALLLQSMPPLVMAFIPLMGLCLAVVLARDVRHLMLYQSIPYPWLPVLNPLIAMWVVRAYRQSVLDWLKRACIPSAWQMTAVAVNPTMMAVGGWMKKPSQVHARNAPTMANYGIRVVKTIGY